MAKMVGLSRNLKPQWLNKTVELVLTGLDEKEIKDQLNEYLSFEIESPTNLRKTREILMNIWVYDNDYSGSLREAGLELIKQDTDNMLPVNWCMMMAAYPVFVDMCKLIGKISEFEETVTLAQIKQKLFDEWGERTTLYHSIDKLVATLKALDVLECKKVGNYSVNKHQISKDSVVNYLMYAMMKIDDAGYYSLVELGNSVYLFPFEFKISKESIMMDKRFSMNTFGGELSVALNE